MPPAFPYAPMKENQVSVFEAVLGGGYKTMQPSRREGALRQGAFRPRPGRCSKCQAFIEMGIFTFTNDVRRRYGMPDITFCITCHESIRATAGELARLIPADYTALVPAWPKPPCASLFQPAGQEADD